jgi:hypothetical protein
MITCHRNTNTGHLEGNVYFRQDATGVLYILYAEHKQKTQVQKLGHFSTLILNTERATTAWYDDKFSTVQIEMPFEKMVIKTAKQ